MSSGTVLSRLCVLVLTSVVAACSGGGSGSTASAPGAVAAAESGTLVIGLTDAEGDFARYRVTVTSVELERRDGTRVEALPLTTTVDFAELVEVTELVTVATVPAGVYEFVQLGLDFEGSEILVENAAGEAVPATPLDADGSPLDRLSVRLALGSDAIRIARGIPAAFSLDFDLAASNEVDLAVSPATATVQPFLLASAEFEADRTHRVRGLLDEVDEAGSVFTLAVRPFRHRQGGFGELSVSADDATHYEIDGATFTGAHGLDALAVLLEQGDDVPVVAGGRIDGGDFVADTVVAGTSVPWAGRDAVQGVVVARTGDALTLRGVVIDHDDGRDTYRAELTVVVNGDTRVTALGLDDDTLSKDSLSVGQRVLALGELTDDATLDAASGHVRMEISQVAGTVVQASPLAVAIYTLNGRRPDAYDFTGTGLVEDADPDFYEIDTATLPLAGVVSGDLVRVRGHVNAFGAAPHDFLAQTVIDPAEGDRSASLAAVWPADATAAVLGVAADRIDLDLADARALLALRGVLYPAPDAIALVAPGAARGVYAVRVRGSGEIHLYRSFEDLTQEVIEQLDSGNPLRRAGAFGSYNPAAAEFTTRRLGLDFVQSGDVD